MYVPHPETDLPSTSVLARHEYLHSKWGYPRLPVRHKSGKRDETSRVIGNEVLSDTHKKEELEIVQVYQELFPAACHVQPISFNIVELSNNFNDGSNNRKIPGSSTPNSSSSSPIIEDEKVRLEERKKMYIQIKRLSPTILQLAASVRKAMADNQQQMINKHREEYQRQRNSIAYEPSQDHIPPLCHIMWNSQESELIKKSRFIFLETQSQWDIAGKVYNLCTFGTANGIFRCFVSDIDVLTKWLIPHELDIPEDCCSSEEDQIQYRLMLCDRHLKHTIRIVNRTKETIIINLHEQRIREPPPYTIERLNLFNLQIQNLLKHEERDVQKRMSMESKSSFSTKKHGTNKKTKIRKTKNNNNSDELLFSNSNKPRETVVGVPGSDPLLPNCVAVKYLEKEQNQNEIIDRLLDHMNIRTVRGKSYIIYAIVEYLFT
jgi:hypothetical protein